jgi:hypothetical protein
MNIIRYIGDCSWFTICACYFWKILINVGLEASLDNMKGCIEYGMKSREVDSTKIYKTNDESWQ